ncbi:LPXTG cell wall anchor domain-containing protein [Micromonospora tarensis]|uniref:LPXTG cell wall anchor domain-containing protein n=1 Tax=Micromonospora tarensis TaxID=2806100 RepID=A0ABS1YLG2_9ACTN|nr:LPXTG cell wall anchor domain-containing protein [Micromonospora tarensis]MBM0278260.1 LPXTG cell wall anchor domain-containing protein [Micromonospora tarensis]
MKHLLRSGLLAATVLALSALSALAAPTVAAAATSTPSVSPSTRAGTAAPTILARADLVFLKGTDPWFPAGPLEVSVVNQGATAAKGFFVLRLPTGFDLDDHGDCRVLGGAPRNWLCGGAELPARGDRTYRLSISSSSPEPRFGSQAWGSVAGRNAAGVTDAFTDFRINWPDRTSMRLRATATPVVDGTTTVRVQITNTGTFDVGGYAVFVTTPTGVRVSAPECADSGRTNGPGCEILRRRVLADGATDTFDVRLAVTGGTKTVQLTLAPVNRYTNKDTTVSLRLSGAGGSGAGEATTSPSASPSGTPTPTGVSTPEAAQLPRTGASGGTYGLIGAVLVALGTGLLVLWRRLARN